MMPRTARPSAAGAGPSEVDVAALLRAQAHALRAQADAIDAQARVLEANVPVGPSVAEPAPLLSKQQLASALGVSTATIDRLCRESAIPFLTVGDSRRFELMAVREALSTSKAREPPSSDRRALEVSGSGVRRLTRRSR
jgi:excisionase family DNA binding protein